MKKNTLKLESKLAKKLVENSRYCNRYIDKKEFAEFMPFMESLNNSFYAYYLEVEKDGAKVAELENTCFQTLRNFLSAVGKVNGANIKAGSKTGDNSTLFLDCVAFCHKSKKRVKNADLASVLCEKKSALKSAKESLEKDDIKAYKAHTAKAKELTKKAEELQAVADNADKMTAKNSVNAFARLFEERLRSVIIGQLSQSEEELQAEKARLNAERKARRKASESKQAPKAKKTVADKAKAPVAKKASTAPKAESKPKAPVAPKAEKISA